MPGMPACSSGQGAFSDFVFPLGKKVVLICICLELGKVTFLDYNSQNLPASRTILPRDSESCSQNNNNFSRLC